MEEFWKNGLDGLVGTNGKDVELANAKSHEGPGLEICGPHYKITS